MKPYIGIEDTDWQIQLDNCLPSSLKECIFIPKHKWYRVIKGTGTLKSNFGGFG